VATNEEDPEIEPLETGAAGMPLLSIGSRKWCQAELAEAITKDRLTLAEQSLVREFLWTLGFKTVKKQLRTGELAQASAAMRRPIEWQFDDQRLLRESEELRDELAAEVLLRADGIFFENVQHWNPDKGAALPTYFIGACKQAFKGAYLAWANARERRWLTTYQTAAAPWLDPNYSRSFTDQIEIDETIAQVFELAQPNQKAVLGLLYQGYSQADTAKELGLTPKTVERRMYQLRRKVLLAVGAGKITPPMGFTSVPSPTQFSGPVMV
jgi:RNA polymerase sigma factor (sigma-70 family)